MTKTLLTWMVSGKMSLAPRLIVVSLILAILPLAVAVDALRLLIAGVREQRLLSAGSVRCSCGREVELQGGWKCSCSIVFEGNGFGQCPACGERSWIVCACGRSIKNPRGVSR